MEFSTQSHDVVEHHVTVQDELTVPLCDSVNNVISTPLEGIQNTVYTC